MSSFNVGDTIKQRHQAGGGSRLVIALTDNPDVVIVFDATVDPNCPTEGAEHPRYKRVFVWSHELAAEGTDGSRQAALMHVHSEGYTRLTQPLSWW